MKKGFTLVELLVIIVLLAVLAMLIYPNIVNQIEKKSTTLEEKKLMLIFSASDEYLKKHSNIYSKEAGNKYFVKVEDLIKENLIAIDIEGYDDKCIIVTVGKPNGHEIGDCGGDFITRPIIKGSLVPVTIDEDGIVKKADTLTEWYNYKKKKWANAVILKDESVTYNNGDTIPESNIESYFVWIPRFRYKLWNTGEASKTAHSIEIVFETKDVAPSTGTNNGDWLTHPAFTSLNVNGFWVGKFETGYDGATSTATAQVNSNDSNKIVIKPNVYSWRNITVGNIFTACYNYKRSNDENNLDSHMMKNTEWGAVAYLSHSKYGKDAEVNINNNSAYRTGYSALPSTDQSSIPNDNGDSALYNQPYNTEIGYLASTTGNITGIYDMSGGAWEYVAGYSGVGNSELNPTNYDSRYFDVYPSDSITTSYENRILGDATGEMGPITNYKDNDDIARYHNSWYADEANFVESSFPWFGRGGSPYSGVLASQFDFYRYTGGTYTSHGFRLILAPQ